MKIAIIGYGRMGHIIERIAKQRGHHICAVIDAHNIDNIDSPDFKKADVAIEFTTPSSAVDCILRAFAVGVPVVSGTTGWDDSLPDLRDMCDKGAGTLIHASNFSIGVNVFMAVNHRLASLMNRFPEYSPSILEVHHIHKLDHPSGTAVTLANEIVEDVERIQNWQEPDCNGAVDADSLPVAHERRGEVPGIHTITWKSDVDEISIRHEAFSRDGFALGAVLAAEWLAGKKGYHTFSEVLGIND